MTEERNATELALDLRLAQDELVAHAFDWIEEPDWSEMTEDSSAMMVKAAQLMSEAARDIDKWVRDGKKNPIADNPNG